MTFSPARHLTPLLRPPQVNLDAGHAARRQAQHARVRDFLDYYIGIHPSEALPARTAFDPAAIPRLLDLGIEDYLLADVMRGVVGQRLLRRLCPHCSKPADKSLVATFRHAIPKWMRAQLKAGETVVFSWIVFKSRAQRDRVNAKVMKDPRLAKMMDPKAMPFDAKRMFWGGFKVLVEG